jgi:hypothetical protein
MNFMKPSAIFAVRLFARGMIDGLMDMAGLAKRGRHHRVATCPDERFLIS